MQLFKQTLSKKSFQLLKYINSHKEFREFYLAGGTSLSLQIGHRESIDLDFFTPKEFSSNIIDSLKKDYKAIAIHNNSIEVIMDETKVFFFYFGFPLLKDLKLIDEIRFANPIDIGLMKLLAVQGRTTRKDIIDLYFIDKEIIPLEDLIDLFQKNYPKEKFNSVDSLKSLLDTDLFEFQPMPKMLRDFEWESSKEYVIYKLINYLSKNILKI